MELSIFFENVGQGDTIFIHWDNNSKFALIDCNLVNNDIEYVKSHIKKYGITNFEFVLMSHPHSDHFSGFEKFLEFCETNNIVIHKFIHTAPFDPKRISMLLDKEIGANEHYEEATFSVTRNKHKTALWSIFTRLDEQHRKKSEGFIKAVHTISNDYVIVANSFFCIKFLAPYQYDEFDRYIKQSYKLKNDKAKLKLLAQLENNPQANLLSSLLQIYSEEGEWQVLLCSDITKYSLKRYTGNTAGFQQLTDKTTLAAQVPHHGSSKNHSPEFWNRVKICGETYFIISVGEGYGHPHYEVVNFFDQKSGRVHATNYVGGFKKYHEKANADEGFSVNDAILAMPGVLDDNFLMTEKSSSICGPKILTIKNDNGKPKCYLE